MTQTERIIANKYEVARLAGIADSLCKEFAAIIGQANTEFTDETYIRAIQNTAANITTNASILAQQLHILYKLTN